MSYFRKTMLGAILCASTSTLALAQAIRPSSLVGNWIGKCVAALPETKLKLSLNADSTWVQAWYADSNWIRAMGWYPRDSVIPPNRLVYNQDSGHWVVVGDTLRLVGEVPEGPKKGEVRFTTNLIIKSEGKVLEGLVKVEKSPAVTYNRGTP